MPTTIPAEHTAMAIPAADLKPLVLQLLDNLFASAGDEEGQLVLRCSHTQRDVLRTYVAHLFECAPTAPLVDVARAADLYMQRCMGAHRNHARDPEADLRQAAARSALFAQLHNLRAAVNAGTARTRPMDPTR